MPLYVSENIKNCLLKDFHSLPETDKAAVLSSCGPAVKKALLNIKGSFLRKDRALVVKRLH